VTSLLTNTADSLLWLPLRIKAYGESVTPSNLILPPLLDSLLKSKDIVLRARAENFRFEERVSQARQRGYETEHSPVGGNYEDWLESHKNYLETSVYKTLPDTFLSINSDAALPAAVSSEVGQEQVLVRVESLDYALGTTKIGSLANLENILAIYREERHDANITTGDAKALLQEVCRSLNQNPYAVRPRFAAFGQELAADIDAVDWPLRLRDRLGLAHLPPTSAFGPHPVVLMRYTVKEVTGRAHSLNSDYSLVVPTVLDAEPYEIFHPAPKEQNFGRTLNLTGYDAANAHEQLASEVLHLKIEYSPNHFWKVGAITKPADISPGRLEKLRSDHLVCLQLLSNRDDFGIL
jgi:hypothetical protein